MGNITENSEEKEVGTLSVFWHMSMSLASQGLLIHRGFNEVKRVGFTEHKSQTLVKVHSSSVKSTTEVTMGDREQVLLKFGLLSDIQHTPVPAEGFSFHGNPR